MLNAQVGETEVVFTKLPANSCDFCSYGTEIFATGENSYTPPPPLTKAEQEAYGKKQLVDLGGKIKDASSGGDYLVNPTGAGIRSDAGGDGHWGASRGNRTHKGLDFSSVDGQNVYSPISGMAINSSFINGNGTEIPAVVIIPYNKDLGFDKMQILYTGPVQGLWRDVNAGEVVGQSVNLQSLGYPPNVGPHIHLQISLGGTPVNPTPYFGF